MLCSLTHKCVGIKVISHVVYMRSDTRPAFILSGAETASGNGEQQLSGQGEEEDGDVLSTGSMSRTQSAELQDGGDEEQQGRRRSNSGALARIIKRYGTLNCTHVSH